jgi:hypothetical protein
MRSGLIGQTYDTGYSRIETDTMKSENFMNKILENSLVNTNIAAEKLKYKMRLNESRNTNS